MASTVNSEENTILVDEDMDALSINHLRTNFEDVLDGKAGSVVIDMSSVNFIDSSGIGALVFLFKRLTAAGRLLKIVGVHGQPADLFNVLRIDKTISVSFSDKTNKPVGGAANVVAAS